VKSFSYKKKRKNILELFREVTQTVIMPTVIDIIVNRKNANTRLQD
jgi:hypothetical protein